MGTVILRNYQTECKEAIYQALDSGLRKVVAVLPTGAGKTVIFGSIASEYIKKHPDKRVVILSHLGLLITQTAARFKKDYKLKVGILQGNNYPNEKARCIISTMQSFRSEKKIKQWADGTLGFFRHATVEDLNIGLIIIDEAHFAGCESYQLIIDKMFPEAKVIGFTATPFRTNKLMTKLFEKVAYTVSTDELIRDGYLVPPRLNMVRFDTDDKGEMFSIIIKIIKERHPKDKVVVYMKTIEEAEDLRTTMLDAGLEASAITSKLTGELRDKIIDDYTKGKGPQVLTTVDVLTAGFDAPNLKVLIMPYKIGSVTTYLQRVGRGLRTCEGKSYCEVYAGCSNPSLDKGFWEKTNKEMLHQGKKDKSDLTYEDILEFAKNDMTKEMIKWNENVVAMIEKVKVNGMVNLSDMINRQVFPQKMLNFMLNNNDPIYKTSYDITKAQKSYLEHSGLPSDLNSQEASMVIDAHKKSRGIMPDPKALMTDGKYKGCHVLKVPKHYISFLKSKGYSANIVEEYHKLKAYVGKGA